jgi:hypothetical protein
MIKCRVKDYYENNGLVIALKDLKTKIKQVNADIETYNTPRKGVFMKLYDMLAPIPPVVRAAWLLGFWWPPESRYIAES